MNVLQHTIARRAASIQHFANPPHLRCLQTRLLATMAAPKLSQITSINPSPPPPGSHPSHWNANPPTSFTNPWPSYHEASHGFSDLLSIRYGKNRNFVPTPTSPSELVPVRTPTWGRDMPSWQTSIKATWLGHAGFLVELPCPANASRGITILADAVFASRMSPVSFAGPKRFTPPPCTMADLPPIDLVVISHDHYDHLDIETIRHVLAVNGTKVHFLAALGLKKWFTHTSGLGVPENQCTDLDWWDQFSVDVTLPSADGEKEVSDQVSITSCPTQHFSSRTPFDRGARLWCSYAIAHGASNKNVYFAGDTAYRSRDPGVPKGTPPCPAFKTIGELLGPFDLALLPIGCFSPKEWMSNVHASPEDTLEIHKEVRSKRSVGMHYGTIRGGLSGQYEPVGLPEKEWREVCEKEGRWGAECGLCDIGETVAV